MGEPMSAREFIAKYGKPFDELGLQAYARYYAAEVAGRLAEALRAHGFGMVRCLCDEPQPHWYKRCLACENDMNNHPQTCEEVQHSASCEIDAALAAYRKAEGK